MYKIVDYLAKFSFRQLFSKHYFGFLSLLMLYVILKIKKRKAIIRKSHLYIKIENVVFFKTIWLLTVIQRIFAENWLYYFSIFTCWTKEFKIFLICKILADSLCPAFLGNVLNYFRRDSKFEVCVESLHSDFGEPYRWGQRVIAGVRGNGGHQENEAHWIS